MKEDILQDFPDAFSDDITKPANVPPVKLEVIKDQKPFTCQPPKQIEYFLEKPAQQHLQELLDNKIIKRVHDHTQFCSKAKFLQKNSGGICMVVNYIHLNRNLKHRGEPFMGTEHICSNPQKIEAIKNFPTPKTKVELMSFLGLVKTT